LTSNYALLLCRRFTLSWRISVRFRHNNAICCDLKPGSLLSRNLELHIDLS
jgi:hypothetical protein